jgi:hypothetical protein
VQHGSAATAWIISGLQGSPAVAATAAHGVPGDRPPALPAVSRCRVRQHHDQAVTLSPDASVAGRVSRSTGLNAAHCLGRMEAGPARVSKVNS